jgi:anti-sigma factor RsiW
MDPKADCLDETSVLKLLDGTFDPETRAGVERHLADCSGCMDLMTWAAADLANRRWSRWARALLDLSGLGSRASRLG